METTPSPEQGTAGPLPAASPRRNFLVEALSIVLGGIVALVPAVAGLLFFLDPLRKRTVAGGSARPADIPEGFIKVATLDAVPAGGEPAMFRVIADRVDAWNTFPNEPIGAIYLRRTPSGEVIAFNVICPHLGCAVDYKPAGGYFHCPCHDSSFTVDGQPKNATPPRGLDTLEVLKNKLADNEVWVKFQNFRTGEPHKTPKV